METPVLSPILFGFLIIVLLAVVHKCNYDDKELRPIPKFTIGQTVYLKPDSIKAVVKDVHPGGEGMGKSDKVYYTVTYFNNSGNYVNTYVEEFLLY